MEPEIAMLELLPLVLEMATDTVRKSQLVYFILK